MKDFLEKFLKLKTPIKAGISLALFGALFGGYWGLFHMDLLDQLAGAEGRRDELVKEKESYVKRKREYLAYRNELNQLLEEQRELLRVLPRTADRETFIQTVQEQLETTGLKLLSMRPEGEQNKGLYIAMPVSMEVRGTYHRLSRFFKNISELKRIVNAENLSLTPERSGPVPGRAGPLPMRARFRLATFRFAEGVK